MRLVVALVVAFVALATVAGVLLAPYQSPPSGEVTCCPQVSGRVTNVSFTFDGPTNCWTSMRGPGFALLKGGGTVTLFRSLTYSGGAGEPTTCTVRSVRLATPGFVFVRANVPLSVSAGTSAQLNLTVTTPSVSASHSTTLSVFANVTSP